jgi:hypothetical protein
VPITVRTTPEAVQEILLNNYDGETNLEPFITAAAMVVGRRLATLAYTADELAEIERWLAAHFATVPEGQLRAEQAGQARDDIAIKIDLGLDQTTYGQTARVLDTLGGLAGVGAPQKRVKFFWAGKHPDTPVLP